MDTLLRLAGYLWALPNTAIGIVLGILSFQRPRIASGVAIFDRGPRGFLWVFGRLSRFRAITFGHVILSTVALEGRLLRHELHHVAQYEVLGPLYLPTYAGVWALRGYDRHPLEAEAAAASDRPTAPRPPRPSPRP